jgi:hypothetical protein
VVRVRDSAAPFQDQIPVDGPDRADLLLGDHALSLPVGILTGRPRQGAREITASDALAGRAFRRDQARWYRGVAVAVALAEQAMPGTGSASRFTLPTAQ